jgi:hypothetical protein
MPDKELFLAEYGGLRNEILKRIEIVHQLKAGALLAWTAVLGFALQGQGEGELYFLYPIVALAIAYLWAFNNRAIILMGNYIRVMEEDAEEMGGGLRWEHYARGKSSGVASAAAVFLTTQVLTLLAATFVAGVSLSDWRMVVGLAACVLTGFLVWRSEQRVPFPERRVTHDRAVASSSR